VEEFTENLVYGCGVKEVEGNYRDKVDYVRRTVVGLWDMALRVCGEMYFEIFLLHRKLIDDESFENERRAECVQQLQKFLLEMEHSSQIQKNSSNERGKNSSRKRKDSEKNEVSFQVEMSGKKPRRNNSHAKSNSEENDDDEDDNPHQFVHPTTDPEKPYTCEKCDHLFSRKWHAIDHVRRVHFGHRQFVCEDCGARFKQKCTMQRHTQSYHSDRVVSREISLAEASHEKNHLQHTKNNNKGTVPNLKFQISSEFDSPLIPRAETAQFFKSFRRN